MWIFVIFLAEVTFNFDTSFILQNNHSIKLKKLKSTQFYEDLMIFLLDNSHDTF